MRTLLSLLFILIIHYTIDAQNSALYFDGNQESLTLSHLDDYNIGDGFTIEAWIFAETWKDQIWQGSIVAKDNQGPDRGFAFRCGDNGKLSFVMSVDNVWQEAFTSEIMSTNQWHHVATVVDDGTIKLYIDGQESATHNFTGNPSHGPDLAVSIGASTGFGQRFFNGVIDEVRIWNDARTPTELADNATLDLTGSEANLVAYFPMNEGSGTVAGDTSPNGNNATLLEMDDSNWVDGYTLPDLDVSVQNIYGIDVINMISRPVKMKVDLLNSGTMAISNIDLAVSINGNPYTTETVTNTINAGDLFAYEFELPIDLIGLTDPLIEVQATLADDGNNLNNTGSLEVKTGSPNTVIVSDKGYFRSGETQNSIKMNLPGDLHKYEQVLLNIDLTCPSGGCGAWDVLADLKAVTATGTHELARYITPYGIACGGWVVDITDFKSVLGGEVEFLTSIILYTAEGWLLDMSIELIDNNSTDTYTRLTSLWQESYQVYGEPTVSHDLEPIAIDIANNTESSHTRMTITGHGQGNTNNAAEFFPVTHALHANGSEYDTHYLWKNDCAANPCSGQGGNWTPPRAGWCPGQDVIPYIFNTTSVSTAGSSLTLDYELMDYVNLLNTGYNGSSHTEPYYRIHSYFIENSSTPYVPYRNLYTENASAAYSGGTLESVTVTIGNDGFEDLDNFTIKVYHDGGLVATETFNETITTGATVEKEVTTDTPIGTQNIAFVEVTSDSDDNPGDNVTTAPIATGIEDLSLEYPFDIFPNPTTDGQLSIQHDEFWNQSTVSIYTTNGILVNEFQIQSNVNNIQLKYPGMYWYSLTHPTKGRVSFGKIVYVK